MDELIGADEIKHRLAAEREGLLQILLEILNSAAEYGVGPHTRSFRPKSASDAGADLSRHIRKKTRYVYLLQVHGGGGGGRAKVVFLMSVELPSLKTDFCLEKISGSV